MRPRLLLLSLPIALAFAVLAHACTPSGTVTPCMTDDDCDDPYLCDVVSGDCYLVLDGGADADGSDAAGSGGSGGSAPEVCSPGQQIACPCLGAPEGVQACLADGSGYAPCQCGGGSGGAPACVHDPCAPGAPLDPACSMCVQTVCGASAICCTQAWDSSCVALGVATCGLACGQGDAGS